MAADSEWHADEATVEKRVLSVQSHVIHGHVGNKSATFPLQFLGFNVDALDTVQFTNHTGYGKWKGDRFTGEQVESLLTGLEDGFVDLYTHILTGYVGNEASLSALAAFLERRCQSTLHRPFILVDPVLGDNGRLYVSPNLIPLYRDRLCRLADLITPNHWEAEWLTGLSLKSSDDAWHILDALHALGPSRVVITSAPNFHHSDSLILYASERLALSNSIPFSLTFPLQKAQFTGTGDLFAALLLAYLTQHESLVTACEWAIATMQHVLEATIHRAKERMRHAQKLSNGLLDLSFEESRRFCELDLIGCQRDYWTNPVIRYHAVKKI